MQLNLISNIYAIAGSIEFVDIDIQINLYRLYWLHKFE